MKNLAQRLDPCVNWFRLLARTKGRILWVFPAVLFVGFVIAVRGNHPLLSFLERRDIRKANSPLWAEAKRLDLGYEQVRADPAAMVGKPVVWCINTPAEVSYVAFRPEWSVVWTNRTQGERTNSGTASYCLKTLAVVEGVDRGAVRLRFVERL